MLLTFALFVGTAVLAVALYVAFSLRAHTGDALDATLREEAQRVARVFDRAPTQSELLRLVNVASSLHGLYSVVYESDGSVAAQSRGAAPTVTPDQVREAGGILSREADRTRFFYVVQPMEGGRTLLLAQRTPRLYQLVENLLAVLLVSMVLAFVMALLGAWVAAQQVTRPLRRIRDLARQIARGDYAEKIAIESRAAEFHEVAHSLNQMSGSFRTKIDELESLTRLQSEFIGNVSHEVRNPIFAVGGYLEALGSPALRDEQRKKYSDKGLAALNRLQNLFNDLIEIARLEYREDLIRPKVFDLRELVDEVREMLKPRADEKGLALEMANPPLLVRADRNRMRQVVVNLVENAIAYSDEGTVRCRIRRHGDKVRVEVVDNGRGIPEEHQDRIFERFYRVDPDRSRKSGGTGLGLSIVKQILQAHGETIRLDSTLGRGTRFSFDLPYAGDEALSPPDPDIRSAPSA
jgi:signal transduction histidine kinase